MGNPCPLGWGGGQLYKLKALFRLMIKKFRMIMDFIKIEHTLFALPFAYLGAFLAKNGMIDIRTFILIGTAFTGLRTAAMTFNRIIDRDIDALNPRTARRHIPLGLISVREAYAIAFISLSIYFISAYLINDLAFKLSPIPAVTAYIYPYLKRFTTASHYVLGLNLSFAPMGGWIAVKNSFNIFGEDKLPFLIGIAVIFWVAGFDMIYAIQDYDFDRKYNLYSFPARFGIKAAKIMALINHIVFYLILLFALTRIYEAAIFAKIGLLVVLALIIIQHLIVNFGKDDRSIQIAFFNLNAILSLSLLLFTFLDVLLKPFL